MKRKIFFILLLSFMLLQSCRKDGVTPVQSPGMEYKEIVSANIPGDVLVKLYINTGDSLTLGYNDVFMKVWKNSNEQNSGYVKLFPKMWMTPTYVHSTAASERFNFDNSIGYYKGYVVFNMITNPPDVIWYGVFTYVDGNGTSYVQADSTAMYTSYHPEKQWRLFLDTTDQALYMLSLVKPFFPVVGMNEITVLLHKTESHLLTHEELHDAFMSVSVYNVDSLNQSSGNISPVISSDGFYKGTINIPNPGRWKFCDTIRYQGRIITNRPPPMPEFYFEVQ
jgi:hypothetical protein